jgi:glutamine amidotransferase
MAQTTIGVVDYGMGNVLSVMNAVAYCGKKPVICSTPSMLESVDKIILPGVGAFRDCMSNLKGRNILDTLHDLVLIQKRPILGICLGMQAMATVGFEGGEFQGLGWIEGAVKRISPDDTALRVPHIGWNDISFSRESPLFRGLPPTLHVYFVHSYHIVCQDERDIIATADYGGSITAAIQKGHIFGAQFHPEKSQEHGLNILDNFLEV